MQASSTDPSLGKPEFAYTINNVNVLDGPTIDYGYWNVNLYSVVNSPANAAAFAFYAVAGKSNTYYIYNYSAKKWVTYDLATSYNNNMKGFLKLSDTKTEGCYFEITSCTNDTHSGYQMRPYASDGTIDEDCYLNYNGGNGANVSLTVGLWKDPGSQDKGACWILKKVDLGVNSIQTSTNEAKPEHVFTMRNANNDYVNSSLYRTLNSADYAQFAFYEVSGKTNAYYIYNYSAKKWLKYTTSATYTVGKDFVSNGEKSERSEFYITSTAKNGVSGVQIQPYNAAGNAANNYLNFYEGGNNNTDHTIGNYTDNGSSDAGSLWVFTEVEIVNPAVITSTTIPTGTTTDLTYNGQTTWKAIKNTPWEITTPIDWDTQQLIVTVDLDGVYAKDAEANRVVLCVTGADDELGWTLNTGRSIFYNYSSTQVQGYVLEGDNANTGRLTYTNPLVFRYTRDGMYLGDEATPKHNSTRLAKLLSQKNIKIGANDEACSGTYTIQLTSAPATIVDNIMREAATLSLNAQNDVDVQLKRSLSPAQWNTFCVPFTISEDVIAEKFGAGTLVYTFGSMNGNVMNFKASTTIEAGKPYIVKPANTVVNPTFTGVNIVASDPVKSGENGFFMQGTYGAKTDLLDDGTNLFLGEGNKFYKPAKGSTKMKGMRAFFIVPQGTNLAALRANIDGATTAIDEFATVVEQPTDNRIYNLQGQFVGTSFEGLHGVYVQNGKKVLVK